MIMNISRRSELPTICWEDVYKRQGPHRDDLCVMANGIDIRKYGSQGQQRTAALSLKLSEIYIVKRKIKDTPVLLLDDVLSELDSSRQNYLLDSISAVSYTHLCSPRKNRDKNRNDSKKNRSTYKSCFNISQWLISDIQTKEILHM